MNRGLDVVTLTGDEYEELRKDAERYRFCVSFSTMPVIAMDGKTWCMFVAVKGNRRSLFTGATPSDAIDAAMREVVSKAAGSS